MMIISQQTSMFSLENKFNFVRFHCIEPKEPEVPISFNIDLFDLWIFWQCIDHLIYFSIVLTYEYLPEALLARGLEAPHVITKLVPLARFELGMSQVGAPDY